MKSLISQVKAWECATSLSAHDTAHQTEQARSLNAILIYCPVTLRMFITGECQFLRRLNKIIHLSKSGHFIVKLDSSMCPKLGQRVFDNKLREIGKIQDLFGPVANPYISITPTTSDPSSSVGKIAYMD